MTTTSDTDKMSTVTATRELTASDRCDRCGAQAWVRVQLRAGELHFCKHHADAYGEPLQNVAIAFLDETSFLDAMEQGLV
jgi:hypothetical protein